MQVWDSGIGIADTMLPRIFDEFFQVQVAGLKLGVQNLQWQADKPAPAMRVQVAARLGAFLSQPA